MSIMKLFVSGTGTTYASDNSDVQKDGTIYALFMYLSMTADSSPAAGDSGVGEVSFLSTNSVNVHGTLGSIAQLEVLFAPVLASSQILHGANHVQLAGLNIPVTAGERVYVFARGSESDITVTTTAILFIEDTARRRGSRRR